MPGFIGHFTTQGRAGGIEGDPLPSSDLHQRLNGVVAGGVPPSFAQALHFLVLGLAHVQDGETINALKFAFQPRAFQPRQELQ